MFKIIFDWWEKWKFNRKYKREVRELNREQQHLSELQSEIKDREEVLNG